MRIWTLTAIALVLCIACSPVNPQSWVIILLFCYLVMTLWPALSPNLRFLSSSFLKYSPQFVSFRQVLLRVLSVFGLMACALCGFERVEYQLAQQLPVDLDHQVFTVTGIITANSIRSHSSFASGSFHSQNIKLDVSLIELQSGSSSPPVNHAKVRLSYYPLGFGFKAYERVTQKNLNASDLLSQFAVGQVICFEAKLRRPRGLLNFTGFDYEKWLVEQGYYATGYIRSLNVDCRNSTKSTLPWHQDWRLSVVTSLNRLFDQKQWANSDVMLALITGSKERMTQARKDWLTQAGLSHLIVISGLHIGLVMAAVYVLSYQLLLGVLNRLNPIRYSPRVMASLLAIVCAWSYCLLAGFSASAMRAAIMGTALCIARAYGLRWPVLSGLLLAMLILLLINPLHALSSGFWLSFGAVLMIYWAVLFSRLPQSIKHMKNDTLPESHQPFYRFARHIGTGCLQLVKVQLALLVLLTPIVLFTVETFHLASFMTNMLCVPIFSVILVPALLIASLVYAILPELGIMGFDVINTFLMVLFEWVDAMLSLENNLGMHSWSEYIRLDGLTLGLVLFALLLWVYFRSALGLIPLFLLLPILLPSDHGPDYGEAYIDIIDVGQGLSVVVQTQHYRLIYDTGSRFGEFDVGEQVIVPMLRGLGRFHADRNVESDLVISHADMDHAGGSRSVLSYLKQTHLINQKPSSAVDVYSGEPRRLRATWLKDDSLEIHACHGLTWKRDGVEFSFADKPETPPLSNPYRVRSNNQSCVLKITAGGKSILLPGDIEAKAELSLLKACQSQQHCQQFKADVLVVAHHGSKTSSRHEFIQAVNPSVAIASNGYKNRFRHPHASVVGRFEQEGVEFLSTAETGGIFIKLPSLSIEQARQSRYRPWYL